MNGGLRYRLAQWCERHTPWLALRFEHVGPTGMRVYRNVIGKYTITKEQ